MATLWKEEAFTSFHSTQRFYIHIQNLPKVVCQAEIKTLLDEFNIPRGGISIHGSDAFIAFTDTKTTLDAYNRAEVLLLGTTMRPTVITTKGLNRIIYRKVRRNLNFDEDESCCKIGSDNSEVSSNTESDITVSGDETPEKSVAVRGRKRIRPTTIPQGHKRIQFSCFQFFPEEIEVPRLTSENKLETATRTEGQQRSRKMRPRPAIRDESFEDWEKPPEECREIKRIKLSTLKIKDCWDTNLTLTEV